MQTTWQAILGWYDRHGRHDLPWRNTDDIYHIYLSEIMLQQTQVSRVREHFYPLFLEHFPTIGALAQATEEEVLSRWSGLGYYNRARNLHACARLAGDGLPTGYKELLGLPGIGDYTARAICAFGHNQPISVIDTNIARVLKRYFALPESTPKALLEHADKLLNTSRPRDHNLALMDIGSMVCLPKNPLCSLCPLSQSCMGIDAPETYTENKKSGYESRELYYGVMMSKGRIALVRTTGSMYKGMLTLPPLEQTDREPIASFRHSYTKYHLTVNLYEIDTLSGDDEVIWADGREMDDYPLSTLTKKALRLIYTPKGNHELQ